MIKIGLEIHQRLDTHKLFCNCPSDLRKDNPNLEINRKLRAVKGESGKIDSAAKHEMDKSLNFKYQAYNSTTCLVELDEEPPNKLNQEALKTTIQVAKLLNCTIVDKISFMRKTVVDGSNTSGFQRTALIGLNGYIQTSEKKVRIGSIYLEEESAKNIENKITWRLDRLGIPLIEIQTEPDIISAQHAKETAEKIGMILRSTNKIKRGIGSIRQDINISVNNGNRVEIKGFQDLKSIPKVIEKEIQRQKKSEVKSEVRKANSDGTTSFMRPMPGGARMYPETDVKQIEITKNLLKIKKPELIEEKISKLSKKYKIPEHISREIIKNEIDFSEKIKKFANLKAKTIAGILIETPKEIKKRFNLEVTEEILEKTLHHLNKKEISKDDITNTLKKLIKGEKIIFQKLLSEIEIEIELKKLIKKHPNLNPKQLMGEAMKIFKGKAEGKKVMELLNKLKE